MTKPLRHRGGFTSKIHLACDGKGRPLALVLTAGQVHESTQLAAVLDAVRIRQPGRRTRQRPDLLLADKGYSYEPIRRTLRQRQIRHVVPQRSEQRQRRAGKPGRPPLFDAVAYKRRNVIERCVANHKQFRALATRYEKRAANYRALVVLAALLLWLRS